MSRADIALRLPHPAARSGGVLLALSESALVDRAARGGRPPPSNEETVVTSVAPTHQDLSHVYENLTAVIADVIAPAAAEVDRSGAFPRAGIDALGRRASSGAAPPSRRRGRGLADAAEIVEQLAGACGSTAMVALMHYSRGGGARGARPARRARSVAAGRHLSTLAFSEAGSRSHFWAPLGTRRARRRRRAARRAEELGHLRRAGRQLRLVQPAARRGRADDAVAGARRRGRAERSRAPSTGWACAATTPRPSRRTASSCPRRALLGADGAGLDLALTVVLPTFLVAERRVQRRA